MARLIDADALERDIRKDAYCLYEADDAIAFVRDAPTVDAELIRHGHWIKCADGYTRCSRCRRAMAYGDERGIHKLDTTMLKYCFKCGAKMDEEVRE